MSNETETIAAFAQELNEDVRAAAAGGTPFASEVECFAERVLHLFEDAGVLEDPEVCVRGGRLGRSNWEIAGWSFPPAEDEDLSELSILAVLFGDQPSPEAVQATDLRRRFELALHFIREMIAGRADDLEPAAEAAALGRVIYDRRKKLKKVVVHLATDGLTKRLREIDSEWVGEIEVCCSIWDVERLSRLGDPRQEEIDVDVRALLGGAGLPCLGVPEEDPTYDAFLCVVPGRLLYQAYEQYGQRLLELNVRSFLSATNKVNRGIRDTIHQRPDRFFAYNNGLAMTARRVEVETNENGYDEIVRIVGLQIVNGGQTTVSIHRAWKIDDVDDEISKVFVQAKLVVIKTADDDTDGFVELVRSISKNANSQSAVKNDDLEANQPWHVAFEGLSRKVWTPDRQSRWFYERARGSYAVQKASFGVTKGQRAEFERQFPRKQLVTKTDLAKCMNAWAQRPEIVSLGGQKNFTHFTRALNDQVRRPTLDEAEYKRIAGRVILFRETLQLVLAEGDRIPAYRAQVVAYLVSYLSFRMPGGIDFEVIWDKQGLPPAIKRTLVTWIEPIYREIILTANGRNVGEWCKKVGCWESVRALNLEAASDLAKFSSGESAGTPSGVVDAEDALAISECLRLSTDDWEQFQAWTFAMNGIQPWLRGVVQTLRLYALSSWNKRPSAKQAKHAAKLIERWRAESE